MKKIMHFTFFISLIFIVGCSDSFDYGDDEIAAIVRGEEITVGELRFLYPDDKIIDNLDGTIKAKLAAQEVEKLNIDMSETFQEIEEMKGVVGVYPPKDVDSKWAKQTREFTEAQARKLGMAPEEFYEKHFEKMQGISVYVVAYIEEILGTGTVEDSDKYTEQANQLLDELVKEHQDEIEIIIK